MGNRTNEHSPLLTDYDTHSPYSEAYRKLYANICLDWGSDRATLVVAPTSQAQSAQVHTLLLTIPTLSNRVAYRGYATVAANLAIVAAQSGTPTILVDADLRSPHLQQSFGLTKDVGLSELLATPSINSENVASSLQTTFVPDLRVLGAGIATEQATMLMLSNKLEEVVRAIRCLLEETNPERPEKQGSYRPLHLDVEAGLAPTQSLIVFHGPPVLSGADASLLGALVERTFLTIVEGHTTRAQAKQAQEQLERAAVKLAGIITLDL